jgi:hypothetical protein
MRNWKTAIIFSGVLAVGATVHAQGGTLTPLDYAEIQQLYARYAYGLDSGADNGAMFAQVFTADGVLTDESGKTTQGRDKLMELARSNPAKGPTNVQHFVWNVKIEPNAQGATGKAYIVVAKLGETGQPAAVLDGGQYWDDLVKTADGWRIKKREFHKAVAGGGAPARGGAPAPAPAPGRGR